jgi:hypothetical protein
MADLGDAIYAILSENVGVAALVPATLSNVDFNIFPDLAPETIGIVPYIVYKRISGIEDATLSGDSNLCDSRVQIDCVHPTYAGAKALGVAAMAALQVYAGTIGGVTVQVSVQVSQHSFVQPAPSNLNIRTYGRSIDFNVWHVGPA